MSLAARSPTRADREDAAHDDATYYDAAFYSALTARDPRFDGLFFVGVTSTGIYCRPICPARTPKPEHCRFFPTAAAAERASFRPCLRCRPELAPGNAPIDGAHRIALRVMDRLAEEAPEGAPSLTRLAEEIGLSERQLRRIVQRELGASPSGLVRTHRLLLAKQLLTETDLPVIDVAYASGFRSLRRFNDAFRTHYAMPPTRLRRRAREVPGDGAVPLSESETFTLRLAYRPPYDWDGTLAFLAARAMAGVEAVTADAYLRTVRLNDRHGWIRVRHAPEAAALEVDVERGLTTVLLALLPRLRRLFDVAARPDVIAQHLATDPLLAKAVRTNPGLRLPGAFDPFELAVRAVLGQQVSVKAATTLAGRFVRAFGEP
ncbi:MAG: AlkA N-terminal domain-containing protein, partial [Trueperaceae bacterium]